MPNKSIAGKWGLTEDKSLIGFSSTETNNVGNRINNELLFINLAAVTDRRITATLPSRTDVGNAIRSCYKHRQTDYDSWLQRKI